MIATRKLGWINQKFPKLKKNSLSLLKFPIFFNSRLGLLGRRPKVYLPSSRVFVRVKARVRPRPSRPSKTGPPTVGDPSGSKVNMRSCRIEGRRVLVLGRGLVGWLVVDISQKNGHIQGEMAWWIFPSHGSYGYAWRMSVGCQWVVTFSGYIMMIFAHVSKSWDDQTKVGDKVRSRLESSGWSQLPSRDYPKKLA